ncbi:MAG: hypothetical protein ACTSU4_05000 [Promethearchaeota archaeon]
MSLNLNKCIFDETKIEARSGKNKPTLTDLRKKTMKYDFSIHEAQG